MPDITNIPLTDEQCVDIAKKAGDQNERTGKVSRVISEVQSTVTGDHKHKASCVIHVLHTHMGIGPHQDVVDQISQSFPSR